MSQEVVQPPSRREWNTVPIPHRVKVRAATRWTADGDCQISTYSVASHGYAQVGWQSKTERHLVLAHRASWEFLMGPVPLGHTLDHLCKQRRCVNPAHLRILTNYENARRTAGKDWKLGQCANGHPDSFLVDDPHRRTKSGQQRIGKRCKKCIRLHQQRHSWRQRCPSEPMPSELLLASERRR